MLDKQFFSNPQFVSFINKHFIAFHAVRGESEGDKVYKKYGIRATPTVLIADVDGSEIDRQVGYGPPPSKFRHLIEQSLTGDDTFAKLSKRYKKNPDDLLTTFKLARKYERMYDPVKTTQLVNKVLERAEEAKKMEVEHPDTQKRINMYEWARYINASQNRRDASDLIQFHNDFPKSEFNEMVLARIGSYYAYQNPGDEALKFFDENLKKYPDNKALKRYFVNYCIRSESNLDQGISVAEEMLGNERIPDPYDVNTYARILEANDDLEKLDDLYSIDNMESKNSAYAYGLFNFATYWNKQDENLQEAEKMIKLAISLSPDRTYYRSLAAEICFKNEKPEEANRLFGPEFISTRMDKRNDLLYFVRFWSEKGQHLDHVLKVAQHYNEKYDDTMAPQLLASAYLSNGREKEAIHVYGEEFLTKNENNGRILNSYAWFWAQKGKNLQSALTAANKSLELEPTHFIWDTKRLVHLKLGQYNHALTAAKKALALSPNNSDYKDRIKEIKKEMIDKKITTKDQLH